MYYFDREKIYTTLIEKNIKESFLKGTTTVGAQFKEFIVLASDRRVTSGYYIAHRRGKKIHMIDKHAAMTIAGTVADAQKLVDELRANARLYRLERGCPIPIKSLATLASSILLDLRPLLFIVQLIIGGMDDKGPQLFTVDWYGSVTKEKYTATGSGSRVAIGILESGYREGLSINEAIKLAVRAVSSAIRRDVGTGEGIDVVTVSSQGYKELSQDMISSII